VDAKGKGWRAAYCLIDVPKESSTTILAFIVALTTKLGNWTPKILKTDCDLAYLNAAKEAWPSTQVVWCTVGSLVLTFLIPPDLFFSGMLERQ